MSDMHDAASPPGSGLSDSFPFADTPPAPNQNTVVRKEGDGSAVVPEGQANQPESLSSLSHRLFRLSHGEDAEVSTREDRLAAAGIQLGHFVLEERIGMGGMGAVFRAKDIRLQRLVALKVLSPKLSRDSNTIQRFQNEARACAQLDQDHIARVFFIGEDRGFHYIAYEFVQGKNVRDLILEHGQFSPAEALNFSLQVTEALGHMSAAGVVHRDVKPSNILVTPQKRAKLVDLGLARNQALDVSGDLTLSGTTLGTFDYISPEQAKDPRKVDVRSDIYSLGCTMYHMLTGCPPYPDGTVLQKLLEHQANNPPDPRDLNKQVPPQLSAIVKKMMTSDPQRRYATPAHLRRDLLQVAHLLGLRSIPIDHGYLTTPEPEKRSLLVRNLPWLLPVLLLAVIFQSVERYSARLQNEASNQQSNSSVDGVSSQRTGTLELPREIESGLALDAPLLAQSESRPTQEIGTQLALYDPNANPLFPETPRILQPRELIPTLPPYAPGNGSTIVTDFGGVFGSASNTAGSMLADAGSSPLPPDTPTKTGTNTPTTEPPVAVATSPAISIRDAEGKLTPYTSLESACTAAQEGNVILLQFNGVRRAADGTPILEKSIQVMNKSITIRGADGYRPAVMFSTTTDQTDANRHQMIQISGGSLGLVNLDLTLDIKGPRDGQPWSILSLENSDRVRCQDVNLTVVNPAHHPATVVSILPGPRRLPKNMMGNPAVTLQRYEFRLNNSVIRGQADLLSIHQTHPGRIDLEDSLAAVSGSLIDLHGSVDPVRENSTIELHMEHMTCAVGESLITFDSGQLVPRSLVPIRVEARNNLLTSFFGNSPLVAMKGTINIDHFRRLIHWRGEKNFYDNHVDFWSIDSLENIGVEPMSFGEWKTTWADRQDGSEVDANDSAILWESAWRESQMHELTSKSFSLDVGQVNAASNAATDGKDIGADLTQLPQPAVDSTDENPEAEIETELELEE